MSNDWKKTADGADRNDTSSYHPLFCLRASINFTTICLSIGRKVRAAPNKHKGSIQLFWKHCDLPFWANFWKENKNIYLECCGLVKQNLRISSVSRLPSHSSLTTPHGTYINLWFMRSKFPIYFSVITVWLHFSLLGSDIQFNQQTLNLGAERKVYNPGNWRWWRHCGDLTSESVCTYQWPMVLYFKL